MLIDPQPFRVLALCALAALPALQDAAPAPEQDASASPVQSTFSAGQLEQIAGPVALYPDDLLAQLLMAASYPVEVAQAARWMDESPGLQGDALDAALRSQDWDESVKSLCNVPAVLDLLNGNLDWTQDLGDAFLGQKEELFAAIQHLRARAQTAGTLASSEQQTVSQDGEAIVIEPVGDGRLWVPFYSPPEAYGSEWDGSQWPYSDWYQPWDDGWGTDWGWGWGTCNWHDSDVDIDDDAHDSFADKVHDYLDEHQPRAPKEKVKDALKGRDVSKWQHDPVHRKGVNYRNPEVAQKFADRLPANGVSRDEARGRGPRPARPAPRPGGGPAVPRPALPAPRPAPAPLPAPARRPAPAPRPAPLPHRFPSAISGARSPRLDRAGSRRGARSRGPVRRPPMRPHRGRR